MENQISRFHVLDTDMDAEDAILALNQASFDTRHVSLITQGYRVEDRVGRISPGRDRMKSWAGTWGLLLPPASFVLPGLGLVAVAGPLTASLVCAIESSFAIGDIGVLAAALVEVGAPLDEVIEYEMALQANKFLLVVHGDPLDVAKASAVISGNGNLAAA